MDLSNVSLFEVTALEHDLNNNITITETKQGSVEFPRMEAFLPPVSYRQDSSLCDLP